MKALSGKYRESVTEIRSDYRCCDRDAQETKSDQMSDAPTSASTFHAQKPQPVAEHSHARDSKLNVMVEQVNPPFEGLASPDGHFPYQESDVTDILPAAAEPNLHGYGPECIGEETEVVAAEMKTAMTVPEVLVSMDVTLGSTVISESHGGSNSANVTADSSDLDEHSRESNMEMMLPACDKESLPHSTNQPSLSDQTNFVLKLNKDKSLTITPLLLTSDPASNQTLAWMKREWKKARDRAKKRSRRADPSYRTKERAEALVRMRSRRQDPEYRERERARDRQRRKLARQKNLTQRQEERERDRMYKQRRRSCLTQDSGLTPTVGDMSSEFGGDMDSNVTDIESSRDSTNLECTNDLNFQVVEAYNEMEAKTPVETYS